VHALYCSAERRLGLARGLWQEPRGKPAILYRLKRQAMVSLPITDEPKRQAGPSSGLKSRDAFNRHAVQRPQCADTDFSHRHTD